MNAGSDSWSDGRLHHPREIRRYCRVHLNPTPFFVDVPSTYFAFDWIQRMYQDGINTGCSSAPLDYCPGNPVVRGDMAIFLMRGGFNQLLPATAPMISSIEPNTLAPGTSGTFTITGANTTFLQGQTTLVFPANFGVTASSLTVPVPRPCKSYSRLLPLRSKIRSRSTNRPSPRKPCYPTA